MIPRFCHLKMFVRVPSMFLAFALLLFSLGQSAPSSPATPPAAQAARVDPFLETFIDADTLGVAHLDVSRIDTAVIEKYILGLLDDAKVAADDHVRKQLPTLRTAADVFLARFKQLGGRHVYLVTAHADIWPHMQPGALLVKIESGGNTDTMREFLISALSIPPEGTPASRTLQAALLRDDVLFIGHASVFNRLKALKPTPRRDLAFDSSDALLRAAASLTADERRAIRELMPALPAELGGGSTDFLTRASTRFRLELSLPPNPSLTLRFRDSMPGAVLNPDEINGYERLIGSLRDMLLASKGFKSALNDQDVRPLAAQIEAIVKDVLTPGNGALRIEASQIGALAKLALPLSYAARERELRNTTAAYLRAIAQSALIYAADNKEVLPESLEVLVKNGQISEKQQYSPRDPKHRKFIYKPIIPVSTVDAGLLLAWEDVDADAEGLVVAFADGHSEWMTRKAFEDTMKIAQEIKAKYETDLKARRGGRP